MVSMKNVFIVALFASKYTSLLILIEENIFVLVYSILAFSHCTKSQVCLFVMSFFVNLRIAIFIV